MSGWLDDRLNGWIGLLIGWMHWNIKRDQTQIAIAVWSLLSVSEPTTMASV
jgi:hypothetical protein